MPHLRVTALLLLSFCLPGCGPDPDATAAADYVAAMAPVVKENAALDEQFLSLAGQLHAGTLAGAAVATQVESNLLPASRAVVEAARAVDPDSPALRDVHRKVVDVWSARADAYADVARAYHASDLASFDAAVQTERRTRDAEAAWFVEVDTVLAPYGQRLDPFPAP